MHRDGADRTITEDRPYERHSPDAFREALVNAICHRDYSEASGSIDIAIYDDRLEVISTGGLHFGLTVEKLKREHQSRPWNPLVAQAFYMRGIIERWGRGTNNMADWTRDAGLGEPEFIDSRLAFTVRFRSDAPVTLPSGLSPIQEDVLRSLLKKGPLPQRELVSEYSGMYSEDQIQRALQHLRKRQLIVRKGATRSSVWSAL